MLDTENVGSIRATTSALELLCLLTECNAAYAVKDNISTLQGRVSGTGIYAVNAKASISGGMEELRGKKTKKAMRIPTETTFYVISIRMPEAVVSIGSSRSVLVRFRVVPDEQKANQLG